MNVTRLVLTRPVVPLLVLAALASCARAQEGAAAEVVFRVNSALVKDRPLAGVQVRAAAARGADAPVLAQGATDARGEVTLSLAPGVVFVDYALPGHVGIDDSETRIEGAGQVITTSLIPDLEGGEGPSGPRRLAIVLNWGEDGAHVRDVDAHLVHAASGAHVYFNSKQATIGGRPANLDVDDMDGGGPETITLLDPAPGTYEYWVHAYSTSGRLDASDVVVRVLDGGRLLLEARPPAGCDRAWTPLRALEVGATDVRLVPWTDEELASGHAAARVGGATDDPGAPDGLWFAVVATAIAVLLGLVRRRRRP